MRDALLAQIARTPQDPAADSDADQPSTTNQAEPTEPELAAIDAASRETAPASRRRWRRLFALAASVALIVGVGIGIAALTAHLTTPASVIALEQIESAADAQQASVELDSGATATAHWSPSSGQAVLVAEGLESLDDQSTYQLWFVRDEQPVPAGLFRAESGHATALLEGAVQAGDAIAVTVEPAGGSPTGLPTADPIIVIPTA